MSIVDLHLVLQEAKLSWILILRLTQIRKVIGSFQLILEFWLSIYRRALDSESEALGLHTIFFSIFFLF